MRHGTAIFSLVALAAAAPVNAQAYESTFESYGQTSQAGVELREFGKMLELELTSPDSHTLQIAVRERDLSIPAYVLVGASRIEENLPWGDSILVSEIGLVLELPQGQEYLSIELRDLGLPAGAELSFYFQALSADMSGAFPLLTSQGVEWTLRDAGNEGDVRLRFVDYGDGRDADESDETRDFGDGRDADESDETGEVGDVRDGGQRTVIAGKLEEGDEQGEETHATSNESEEVETQGRK